MRDEGTQATGRSVVLSQAGAALLELRARRPSLKEIKDESAAQELLDLISMHSPLPNEQENGAARRLFRATREPHCNNKRRRRERTRRSTMRR